MPLSPTAQARLEAAKAKAEAKKKQSQLHAVDTDDVPDLEYYKDTELKEQLKHQSLKDNWIQLSGKSDSGLENRHVDTSKGEVQVRCPSSTHNDENPSASVNIHKNVWTCYRCRKQAEGDIFDAVAARLGVDRKTNFSTVVEETAKILGIYKTKSKEKPWVKTAEAADAVDKIEPATVTPLPSAVTADFDRKKAIEKDLFDQAVPDVVSAVIDDPAIENTVIKEFLECYRHGSSPTQFHLAGAMALVSLIKGHEIKLPGSAEYGPTSTNQEYVLIGDSGVGKSSSINLVRRILRNRLPFDRKAPTEDGVLQLSHAGSGEVVVSLLDNEEITSPGVPGRKVPTKMLFCTPELTEIAEVASKANNTLESVLNNAYDNQDPLETNAKSSSASAFGSYVFVMTTTQPGMIRKSFTGSAGPRGTINRFTPWYGTPKKERAFIRHTFDDTKLMKTLGELISWTAHPRIIEWAPEAEEEFENWFDSVVEPAKEERKRQGIEADLLTRVLICLKKDTLTWAINCKHTRVELSDVRLTQKMWPYRLYCWDRATDNLADSEMKELSDRILEWVKTFEERKKTLPTRRDIRRGINQKYSNEILKKAMDFLEHFDLLEMVPQPPGKTGGKPTERYRVNEA